ncbi:MAG TPA: alpha/beta hydrolase [Anaerolineales bacterium]|nr:alpha/beta hydrolase [Anaerolineales bacterium]
MELEHSYIETNGIRLHVVQAGPKSGTPVLLLHGFPENWRCWIRQLPALAEAGCRVIVPDQRGYNLSDKPDGIKNYQMEVLTRDILGLIDKLEYEKINLVGHDWGAAVAWSLGIQHPERLHRLGILNVPHPAVMKRFLRRDLEQLRRSWYIFFFQLPWLPEAGMRFQGWQALVRSIKDSGKAHTFSDEDIENYKEAWSQPGAISAMLNWYRAAARYPIEPTGELCVRVPTLMMWGMHDNALTHRMARPSMDYCKEGRLLFFPEATHWVQRDEAEEVNRHLLDFVFM